MDWWRFSVWSFPSLKPRLSNFVAVGGTSGIGEYALKAFVEHTVSPRVYLVGR